ncbi:MAG: leucine-rich repeat protein [Ruminococcus sp.]|nr:leucine-rich repeat protein [Ruminococcus sp.]
MKRSIKRIAASAAALAFVLGGTALPAAGGTGLDISASAITMTKSGGTCGEGLVWTLDTLGTLSIVGNGNMDNYGKGMAPWSVVNNLDRKIIKKVIISEGVTSIGNCAFQRCENLESVTLPESMKTIGHEAFEDCTKLASIEIPESVTNIGDRAFNNTAWLKAKQEEDPLVIVNGILIDGNKAAGDVVIPDGVTEISYRAFLECEALTSVTIPEGVTDIMPLAFYECTGLKSVIFPEGLVSVGSNAFCGCESLTSVSLPESLKSIGTCAFEDCKALEEVYIPKGVTSIGGSAFDHTPCLEAQRKISSYVVINNILIDAETVEGEAVVPEGVTTIGEYAFFGNGSVTSVTIPEGVTSIEDAAFESCGKLESVKLPNSLKSIGEDAFYSDTLLKEVTIPRRVTSIGRLAFGFITADDKVDHFKLHCYDDSDGETYARENGLDFDYAKDCLALSLKPEEETFRLGLPFTVTLNIDENTGLNGFKTSVSFDNTLFELIGCTRSTPYKVKAVSIPDCNKNGKIDIEWSDLATFDDGTGCNYIYYEKGTVLTMKFMPKTAAALSSSDFAFTLGESKAVRNAVRADDRSYVVPVKTTGCTVKFDGSSDQPHVCSPHPDVKVEVKGRQFRLKWNRIYYAEGYGLAVFQSGKWRLKKTFDNSSVNYCYTSPKLQPGKYSIMVCAKVDGKWVVYKNKSHIITIANS